MWAIGLALFLLGIILIIVYAAVNGKHKRCSAKTQGTLINYQKGDGDGDHPVPDTYIYSYNVNGQEYKLKSADRSREINGVGDSCTIWYNPKKPSDAMAYRIQSSKTIKILLILGIIMIPVGLIVLVLGAAL